MLACAGPRPTPGDPDLQIDLALRSLERMSHAFLDLADDDTGSARRQARADGLRAQLAGLDASFLGADQATDRGLMLMSLAAREQAPTDGPLGRAALQTLLAEQEGVLTDDSRLLALLTQRRDSLDRRLAAVASRRDPARPATALEEAMASPLPETEDLFPARAAQAFLQALKAGGVRVDSSSDWAQAVPAGFGPVSSADTRRQPSSIEVQAPGPWLAETHPLRRVAGPRRAPSRVRAVWPSRFNMDGWTGVLAEICLGAEDFERLRVERARTVAAEAAVLVHTRGMVQAEALVMLRDIGGYDEHSARGAYDSMLAEPLGTLAPVLGRILYDRLEADATDSTGATLGEFRAQFQDAGPLPFPILRQLFLGPTPAHTDL